MEDFMDIRVEGDGMPGITCSTVIVVPEKGLAGADYMKFLSADAAAARKHEFQSLAQMALMQFEDRELAPVTVAGRIRVTAGGEVRELDDAFVIARLITGEIVLLTNSGERPRKFLVAAHRFSTRWIRLDL